ncbi:MAG: riboflavin synthase [Nitrospinales bacterium]|nr:riboflavin synthase [Nitrospinales bacterium]
MFSGIVSNVGIINQIIRKHEGAILTVRGGDDFRGFASGESIAVNGVCLTVRDSTKDTFTVDLSTETLSRTCFKNIEDRANVNLERSLTPSDKISGHFVSGHIDCVGHITSIDHKSGEIIFRFEYPVEYTPYIIEKGSVAVDGISLTAFSCVDNGFSVSIIPFTFSNTNLASRKMGDAVNIECDMIGKYIYKACETILLSGDADKKVSLDMLRRQGILK